MNAVWRSWPAPLLVMALCGCGPKEPSQPNLPESAAAAPIDGARYLLDVEPEAPAQVIAARAQTEDGEEVVVTGRIGGSANPWVEGRAAFSIVDSSLQACSDREGDECPVPWDYCCETEKLPTATALVKVVDGQGHLVKADARSLLGVEELETVVVRGKAQRDASGNLTILADGVCLKK